MWLKMVIYYSLLEKVVKMEVLYYYGILEKEQRKFLLIILLILVYRPFEEKEK